jgi:hypothetical protein
MDEDKSTEKGTTTTEITERDRADATALLNFIEAGMPDFILEAVNAAIHASANQTGGRVPEWEYEADDERELAISRLADIISRERRGVSRVAADAKSRAGAAATTTPGRDEGDVYKPITFDQAEELAGGLIEPCNDAAALDLITLLYGIAYAYYAEKGYKGTRGYSGPNVEGIVIAAARRIYYDTLHSGDALREFSGLDPNSLKRDN